MVRTIILLIFLIPYTIVESYCQIDSLSQDLEVIIIKDKRLDIAYSETSRTIDIIDDDEIRRSPAQSLPELLQYVTGLDIRRRGVNGVQADLSIRGGTFDQALVMINGISMSDPQTGHHVMNLPLDLENIERIEILKGSGSRRYGQNAYAGAINIITKVKNDSPLTIRSEYSSNVSGELGIQAYIPTSNASHMLSVSKSFSEGYRYNTDFEMDNLFMQSTIDVNGNSLMINAGYSNREFGANGFYASPNFTEQYEEVATSIVSLKYELDGNNWKFRPAISWRRNQDEYIFIRDNPSIYRNLHIGNSYVGELNTSNINKLGILGIGIEFRLDDLQSNNLGERSRTTLGFNIEQRFNLLSGKLDITPGVALYTYNDFGTKAFPGVDIGVSINSRLKVFGNIGSTWRVPTYTDLYYSDPANLGNPELQPESALNYELGMKWMSKYVRTTVSGFVRDSENLIDWTKENENDQWFPSNIGRISIKGVEVSGKFNLSIQNNTPSLYVGYTYLNGNNNIDATISRYALDLLNHQINVGLDYSISEGWIHSTRFKYVDRINLENYSLLDTKISYRKGTLGYGIFVNNLFDREYTETNLVPMPGRWLGVSLNYKIR